MAKNLLTPGRAERRRDILRAPRKAIFDQIQADTLRLSTAFASSQPQGAETILLVEDEAFVRKVTAEVLEAAGYRLLVATAAAEALQTYDQHAGIVELLLCDVVLPDMSGLELAGRFEVLCPAGRTLFMSGHAECLEWRCRACSRRLQCLAKPFSTATLLEAVREALKTTRCKSHSPSPH